MNTGNGEVPTSIKIRASIGLPSAGGKHGPPAKTRRQEHRRRGSGSRDSSTVYSLDEVGQLVDNHQVHKLAVRTSNSGLYLQTVQPEDQTDISTTLDSDFSMRTSGCGYNYDDVQRGQALELSLRARKSDNGFSFDGSNRQPIEAGESYVNKLMKQTSDIREYGEVLNKLRRTDKEDVKRDSESAEFETRCAVGNDGLKLAEARVRMLSRNPCSASECSSKSQERSVSKLGSSFDSHHHESYKSLSLQYQEAVDLINRSKRLTESDPILFDTKNIGDSDVSVTTNNRDYSRHNESVLDYQTHQDFGLTKEHSRPSRNAFAAAKQHRALAQDTFSFEEKATKDIPKEKLTSRHEDSWQLGKPFHCDHVYGETLGTDKNFSYSYNFGDAEVCASNPTLTKQRLWEQTILEESTVSADTSQCPHSSIQEDVISELMGTTPRLRNVPKKWQSLNNSDKPIVVQVSRGPQNKSCNDGLIDDWKCKKHFRQCSTTLARADAFSKDEKAKDETAGHSRWRADAYGAGSSADAANMSSEDDGAGASLWTCTKWSDENTGDNRHQSKESQWAYEVYSNTCQKPAEQTSKVGMYTAPAQICSNTTGFFHSDKHTSPGFVHSDKHTSPGFVHSDKHTSPGKRETSDIYKYYDLIGSSASERNRCPWNSKLDSLRDGKKVGKLPNFTDISKDYLQLRTDEDTVKSDHAAKTINKFNSDYLHRFCEDKQESADDAIVSMGTRSLEEDQSIHNVKWTRNCDKMCSNPDSGAGAKESSENCLRGVYNISKLIENTLANNKTVNDQCTIEDISLRQTTSSVDAKLMQTVHSIKEDIEDVLQMLSSLDSNNGDKDIAASLLNEAFSKGKPFTAANVNCATDFVRQAFDKLISFKNLLLMQSNEQDDAKGYSYDEYKKGRDDYIADPDILDEDYDIENIFSYLPKTKHYCDTPKAGRKSGTPKQESASRKMDKKNVFEKTREEKKGTPGEGGFDAENASVAGYSQHTASEYLEPTFLYKRHERGQAKSVKITSEDLKSPFKDNSKKLLDDGKQKVWQPVVSPIYGPTDMKHPSAGDRATSAFVNSHSKSRKGSPSPPTNKGDSYAYGRYPTPTFLDSPENSTAESKHSKKPMKIKVEKVIPRRSSSEKQKSRSPKSKTSVTDFKWQKLERRTLPLNKAKGNAENVSEIDIKRKRSNRLTNDKKTTGSSKTKSRSVSSKKDKKEAQVFTAKSKGDNKMTSPKSKWKAPRHAQDMKERISLPSTPESSAKVTDEGLTGTTQTVDADTSQLYDSASRDSTSGAEMFVNRYMVVSEVSEASTPENPTIEEVQDEQLEPYDVPEPKEPSSVRRSKRSSRRIRSRSRSRNRIKKRKKSKLFSEQRASDNAKFSSSDTSLLKTSEYLKRSKTTKIKGLHNQEKSESPLRKPSAKPDKESWFHWDIQKSPSPMVSQSYVDLARKVKNKYRETAAARETRHFNKYYGNSSNSTQETMDWPLQSGYERAGITKTPKSDMLINATDKKNQKAGSPRLDMSTSELNVSIKKLYQEINKLRLQLEASAEDAILRPLPRVDGEVPSKFARSYKVFTNSSPKFPEPVFNSRQTPDFSFRNMSQQHTQPASCQSNGRFSETHNVQTYSEQAPESYDRINEFVNILESHMRNFRSSETKVNNSIQVPTMKDVAENCGDNRKNPESKDNNAHSCTFEASQSVATAREISNWLNEDVYVTATCDDNSDTQNDASDKFETAPSDNDYSSPNCKDVKSNQMPVGTAACNSVNNNMRPTESGRYPEVITVYQKSLKVEKHSPSCRTGKPMHFQNISTSMYEVSSGDVDNSTECHQHNANCLDSSEKRERQCLVELCSETSGRLKDDSMYVSLGSDMNSRVQCDPRSRGQSLATLENIVTTAMENNSQNKGCLVSDQMSEKLHSQLQATPGTFTDAPTTCKDDLGLDQTKNVPFFVKCVKGIFLGSTAATSVMAGNSHQSIQGKQSPRGYSPNVCRSKNVSNKESVVSGSDEDEVSVVGYINASRDSKRYNSGIHHNSSTLECASVVNNYLSKQQTIPESSRSQSRTRLQGITAQSDDYLLNRDLGWDNVLRGDNQWTPREVVVSCGRNNKSKTWMQQNLPVQSSAARLLEPYSPAQTDIPETDKGMNHYSDAISAKTSQRFKSHHLSRANIGTVSKNQDYISGTSNANLCESDRSCLCAYDGGNSQDIPQKIHKSDKADFNDYSNDTRSTLNISEFLFDNEAFLVPGDAPNADQDYIIASFQSMMQQKRPYYVEHCGCRHKKQEAMIEHCNLNRCDVKRERNELNEIKATFKVVTIANDNNSSVDLNRSKIMAPDFHKHKEPLCEDLCDSNGAVGDTGSETTVASTVGLKDGGTFSSNDEIDRSNDIPVVNLGANHNKYNNVADWDSVKDCKEEVQINLGKSLLKPEANIATSDGREAGLSPVDVEIEDCREETVDEISNSSGNLLLDTDEAESWYRTTEEVSDNPSSMKKSDDNTIIEESDDDGTVEEEILEESEDNEDIDYEQHMSDDDDDNADASDSNDYC